MMATGDTAMQLLVQKLKQRFPEIPEHVVYSCVQQCSHDYQRCVEMLSQKSPQYMYGPFSELSINVKPEQDNFETNPKMYVNHQLSSRYPFHEGSSGSVSINRQNGNSSPVSARFSNQNPNLNYHPPYDPRHMANLRSASVSGMSPPVSSTSGYQSWTGASMLPKSAPVMPSKYEPFQSFECRTQGQLYGPPTSTAQMPITMQSGGVLPSYAQQGMYYGRCDYEMRVSYQGTSSSSGMTRYSLCSSSSVPRAQAYVNSRLGGGSSSGVSASISSSRPRQPVRHVTSLNVTPVTPHVSLFEYDVQPPPAAAATASSATTCPNLRGGSTRTHSTTVKLHLQPPSSSPRPQIRINTSGGTVSYNGQHPFKSHFHVSISPGGGSFSTVRTLKPSFQTQCCVESFPAGRVFRPSCSTPTSFPVSPPGDLSVHHHDLSSLACSSTMSNPFHPFSHPPQLKLSSPKCSLEVPSQIDDRVNEGQEQIARVPNQRATDSSLNMFNSNLESAVSDRSSKNHSEDSQIEIDYVKAQVSNQRAQMERLHDRLMTDKQKLDLLKKEVASMEQQLSRRTKPTHSILSYEDIQKLKEETSQLRLECDTMSREVERLGDGKVPIGETSERFYENIYRGPSGPVGFPPPRPSRIAPAPPFPPMAQPSSSSSEEGHQWSCSTCTFLNNPALDKCEICEMPRIMLAAGYS